MTNPPDKFKQRPATAPLKAPLKAPAPKAPASPAPPRAANKAPQAPHAPHAPHAPQGHMPTGGALQQVRIQRPKPKPPQPGFFGKVWGEVKNVGRGAWDATVDMGKGIYEVVRHPKETAKGLVALAKDPKQIVTVAKTMWRDATKHGVGYAIGYIGANLAPTLLTGGGSAVSVTGRVLSVAGKTRTVQLLARIPTVARATRTLGRASRAVGKTRAVQTVVKVGQEVRVVVSKPLSLMKRAKAAIREQRVVRQARVAIGRSAAGRQATQALRLARQPAAKLRTIRDNAKARVADRLEKGLARLDNQVLDTRVGKRLALRDHHTMPVAANPHFERQMGALGTKLEAVFAKRPEAQAGPTRQTARMEDLQRYDEVYEQLVRQDPERLAALQGAAAEAAGVTPRELALWNELNANWTGQMGKVGEGHFAGLGDFHAYYREANRLYEATGEFARQADGPGVYAATGGTYKEHLKTAASRVDPAFVARHNPSAAQRETLQEMVGLVAKLRGTRAQRTAHLAEALGLPPLDASHMRLFRGTDYAGTLKDVLAAWEGGGAHVPMKLRAGESFTPSYEVASDFALAGPRATRTQARQASEASVLFWTDAPRSRVVTDKFTDLGPHTTRELAQRSQLEYVLHYTDQAARIPVDDLVIQFKGQFYAREDLPALKQAIADHPEAWARATGAAP